MDRKWFDFIALLILATIIANMSWYRGFASPENFASIAVYIITALALRTFFYTSKGNPQNIGDKPKKLLGLIFKLSLVVTIIFGIFIYFMSTDEYFAYKVSNYGEQITLNCTSSKGLLARRGGPKTNLFKVVKNIGAIQMTLLIHDEEYKGDPFRSYRSKRIDDVIVYFGEYSFDRSSLDIQLSLISDTKLILLHHYQCNEIDSQIFDQRIKSFYDKKNKSLKF